MLASGMADTTRTDPLRILTVGSRYRPDDGSGDVPGWPALVDTLRARGDGVKVLTTDDPGPALDGVDRSLRWFRAADGGWRRPARLEASRISRHALLRLGETLQQFRPHAVVWVAMGGLPLTLIGASDLPELAVVHDEWPVYGPEVDLRAKQEGWDPGAVACWSCASAALRETLLDAAGGRVDAARVVVDPAAGTAGWVTVMLARLDAVIAARTP